MSFSDRGGSSSSVIRGADMAARPLMLGAPARAAAFAPFPGGEPRAAAPSRPTIEARIAEARRQGVEEGLGEGRAQCEAEMEGLKTTLDLVVRELWSSREQLYREVEPDVVRLAVEVARRVVGEVVRSDAHQLVERLVGEALRRVAARDRITLRVNPEDLELVRSKREHWLQIVEGVEHFEVIEDRRVARGGALVTTPAGSVDARWSTQLSEIERALLGPQEGGNRGADA